MSEFMWIKTAEGRQRRIRVSNYTPSQTRSDLAVPNFMRDCMDALQHPTDDKYYDSKSAFRAVTRASGGEEVGNEVQRNAFKTSDLTKQEVADAMEMVKNGYKPHSFNPETFTS